MKGLGDNIYQRGYISTLCEREDIVFIDTSWPQLFQDLDNVKFVETDTSLRTQKKNIERYRDLEYHRPSRKATKITASYTSIGNIFSCLSQRYGVRPTVLNLPSFNYEFQSSKPIALVRPATVRKEWSAPSRNPDPEYLVEAVKELKLRGYLVVSIADLKAGEEWVVGPEYNADIEYHGGELKLEEALALLEQSDLAVGPIGWLLPAASAYQTPAWIIAGGNGAFEHPDRLTHRDYMWLDKLEVVLPDNFCMCKDREHNCDKQITGHLDKFRAFLDSI